MKCKYYVEPIVNGEAVRFVHDREHTIVSINEHEVRKGRVEVYGVTCGHAEADIGYLESCMEITLDDYKEITKGWYTPSEYLEGENEDEL